MNKATRTSLHAMRKAELIDFTWNLIQNYNEMSRDNDYLRAIATRNILELESIYSTKVI